MAGHARSVRQSYHPLPLLRYSNDSHADSRRSCQGHAQWPSRAIDHDPYDQVPRGLFHGSRCPPPPLQIHGLLDTHYQLLHSPHGTIHFIDPHEQFPVPICVCDTAYPHEPFDDLEVVPPYDDLEECQLSPDAAIPPQYRPIQPFIPPRLPHSSLDPRHHSFVREHREHQSPYPHHPISRHSAEPEVGDCRKEFACFVVDPEEPSSIIPSHHLINQHSHQSASNHFAEAEQIEPTRADAASQFINNGSSPSTVEEIFTEGTAPIPEGQELPRDQSPFPRPTMPPREIAGEHKALGLHDGDIVETVIINDIPFTALVRSPKDAGTMDSLSSGTTTLTDMVLLEPAEVNPSDTPVQWKVREEIRVCLKATSTSPGKMVLHSNHEADGMEEPKRKELKGKEPARDEPIVEQSSVLLLSAPESQRQNDTPSHASSSTMEFYVRKRQSIGSTTESLTINVVPPTTVASSANPFRSISPEQPQTLAPACALSSPPTAGAPTETDEESSANYHPQTHDPMLQQVSPLSTQAEVHTFPQAQSQLWTQYLTLETYQRVPHSGLPLFAADSETVNDRLFTPAEQAKYDYLSRISSWGGSSGVSTPAMSERTYIGGPYSCGSHSVDAAPSGGTSDCTVIGSPTQLVMSPEQKLDDFAVVQNLEKADTKKAMRPSMKFSAVVAPRQWTHTPSTQYLTPLEIPQRSPHFESQAPSLLRRSDQDLPATSEEHVQTATQETNESRESVEADEFETGLHFNLSVLAHQCLRDAETMAMASTTTICSPPSCLTGSLPGFRQMQHTVIRGI
ncbi:hypothetical protein PAXRUDRAFT_338075 [Paxillus rubicundulus Ve08.2h10]|uniref:Uncharacterized protein n=1 Tax=Paxillus rubicundulus Ve08.2h10 TaxID=930991 RepID=A0A0D0D3T7_9AGAM|nr:hypothetical protein PAXRUDRAFT_338075 [Paxillus rubicundulus Ve08.2h10]